MSIDVTGIHYAHAEAAEAKRHRPARRVPGELLALLGPSGCGKTTLPRIVAGPRVPLIAGASFSNGRDVGTRERHVGLCSSTTRRPNPPQRVRENVAFGLRVALVPASRRDEIDRRVMTCSTFAARRLRAPLSVAVLE